MKPGKMKKKKTAKTTKTEKEPTTSVLLKAIRAKCLDCSGTKTEVERCSIKGCALWKWRKELEEKKMVSNKKRDRRKYEDNQN